MEKKSGKLIVFEGIDGSGKTTVSKRFFSHLQKLGEQVTWIREPGNSLWGEKIRQLAATCNQIPISEELDYFIRDRRWNVENNIVPALKKKITVIMDRYFYSTACYQGARGLDMAEILELNRSFAPEPDITFIIDLEVDSALERINSNRSAKAKLFEKKDFLEKVRANYLGLQGSSLVKIDGSGSPDQVFHKTWAEFQRFFPNSPA